MVYAQTRICPRKRNAKKFPAVWRYKQITQSRQKGKHNLFIRKPVYLIIYLFIVEKYVYSRIYLFAHIWFGLVWFYGISNIKGYLMPNTFLYVYTVLSQTIQFKHQYRFFVYTQLNVKAVLFLTIQLSISTLFSSIWSIDRTLSGVTTQVLRGVVIDGNTTTSHMIV